jgi:cystathionine beta-lyase
MARWFAARPEVLRVIHPALGSDPGHAIWKRDFRGERPVQHRAEAGVAESRRYVLDTVTLFGMGYSWGGFESLVIPFDCSSYRTATKWDPGGPTLRFHIGLESG